MSELFHFEDGAQTDGPDAERSDYNTFFSFDDPDGNAWLVQRSAARIDASKNRPALRGPR